MSGYRAPPSLRGVGRAAGAAGLIAVGLGADARAAAPAVDEQPNTVEQVIVRGKRGVEHPYVDPQAPYKTDRSASTKLTEPLLDTPQSVTVLSEQAIEDSGATSFRDLMRTQPGVTLGTGEGGNAFGDRIFIRGFDARNDVYVDGVRDPGVGSRETFAVEQVEILKGPSATFGGRGTTGGAVSLISKAPRPTDFGEAEAVLGTDDTRRATLDVNRALSERVSVRLNAMAHASGVAGRDFVSADRWGVAVAARLQATERLGLQADYFHLSTDELPDWGHPYDIATNQPFQVRRENFYGVLSRDFRETFADIYSVQLDYALSDAATVHSIVRYGQNKNAYTASAPERPDPVARTVSANAKRRDAVTDYLVNQTDLTLRFATGRIAHALVAGYELSREEVANRSRAFTECAVLPCTGTAANPLLNLDRPDPRIPFPGGSEVTGRTEIGVDNRAAYVLDTITLGPRWELMGALRYDAYDVDLTQVVFATAAATRRASSSDFLNWRLGAVFKPRPNGSLYAAYSSSSNPPGEQLDSTAYDYGGLDARTVDLDPARNISVELGTKWSLFGDNLNLTAAVFRIAREKVPVLVGAGASAVALSEGEQRVDGLELGAGGNIGERLSVFGGLTLLDTEITASPVAGQAGSPFPNIPETSFNLTTRLQATDRLHLGGAAIYNSEKFGGGITALSTRAPEFWRLDLFGGFDLSDRLEVSFNVLNVTDELYYDAIYRSATPFTYVAPGRSALVTLDYKF